MMQIIMIKGAVETLEFFSMQMAEAMEQQGIKVWFWDMREPLQSREQFERLDKRTDCVLVTFNFIGLSNEAQFQSGNGTDLWERYGIKSYCIMVDHPMYYYRELISGRKNLTLLCVDRDHRRFVEKYYPEYGRVFFLPLAGTGLAGTKIPYEKRDIPIIFTGNYVPLENLMSYTAGMDRETKEFCFDIIGELTAHPDIPLEQELVGRLKKEFPQITREELMNCMYHMVFIDLYVRSYFRGKIICSLAENGYTVHVIGKDWDKAECKCPKNLVMTGQLDSLQCLRYMQRSKIAVNIMPWFKDGAHDRIFNAMLQGCAVVSDTSKYLDEVLHDGEDFLTFPLEQSRKICDKIQYLLKTPKEAGQIAEAGWRNAQKNHTWKNRAEELLRIIEEKHHAL